jgi:hypothetical protein
MEDNPDGQFALDLGFGGRQIAGRSLANEVELAVLAVAERLIFRIPAAAQTQGGTPGQTKYVALLIANLEVTFDAEWSIVAYRDLCCHSESSP